MARTCVVLSTDSLEYLRARNECLARGISTYLEALVQVDKAKRELRQQWAREQEALATKRDWDLTGNCTD